MNRAMRSTRAALVALAAVVAVGLSGCSGDSPIALGSRGSEGGAVASSAPAARSGSTGGQPRSNQGLEGVGAAPQTSRVLTRIKPDEVATYDVGAATASTRERLSAAVKSVTGVSSGVKYARVSTRGKAVADVAEVSFPASRSGSELFRGQITSQLVSTAARSEKVRFDKVDGQTFTVAGRSPAAVGVFRGNAVVLVLAQTGPSSLTMASGAAYAYLQR